MLTPWPLVSTASPPKCTAVREDEPSVSQVMLGPFSPKPRAKKTTSHNRAVRPGTKDRMVIIAVKYVGCRLTKISDREREVEMSR